MFDLLRLNIQMFAKDPEGDGAGPSGDPAATGEEERFMIPKHRFDEVSRKAKEYEAQVAELTEANKALSEKDAKIKELEERLAQLTEEHETEKALAKKTHIIKSRLEGKVVDLDLVLSLLKLDDIQVNAEGKVKGLSAQVKKLQKSKPFLWKKPAKVVVPSSGGTARTEKTFAQKLAEKKVAEHEAVRKGKNYF